MSEIFVYVGTYTSKDGGEIYICRMNPNLLQASLSVSNFSIIM
ncbi:MAG: hypothetical protein QXW55_03820 [Candidatus Bathyarchaeia archaeon]